jgi:hypothetical protein
VKLNAKSLAQPLFREGKASYELIIEKVSGGFGQIVLFHLVRSHFLRLQIKPLYFYQVGLDVLEDFHHFPIDLTSDSLSFLKQPSHKLFVNYILKA